jgi:hypothetical protein
MFSYRQLKVAGPIPSCAKRNKMKKKGLRKKKMFSANLTKMMAMRGAMMASKPSARALFGTSLATVASAAVLAKWGHTAVVVADEGAQETLSAQLEEVVEVVEQQELREEKKQTMDEALYQFRIYQAQQWTFWEHVMALFEAAVALVTFGLGFPLVVYGGYKRAKRQIESMRIDGRHLAWEGTVGGVAYQYCKIAAMTAITFGFYVALGFQERSWRRYVDRNIVWADEVDEDAESIGFFDEFSEAFGQDVFESFVRTLGVAVEAGETVQQVQHS